MTVPMTTGTLRVPGADLYYERRGSGPLLVLIPGGAADAGLYGPVAGALAAQYTVVAYDPRGMSRSRTDPPATEVTAAGRPDPAHDGHRAQDEPQVSVWSDDLHRLIGHLGAPEGSVSVLGCSSGAIVALDLLARFPGPLRRVVVHEPPLLGLLPDPAPYRALFTEVRDKFRQEGAGPAMAHFAAGLGGDRTADGTGGQTADETGGQTTERTGGHTADGAGDGEETGRAREATEVAPEIQEMAPRMHANLPLFLDGVLCSFSSYLPDLAALRPVADRLVVAAGRDSRDQVPLYGPPQQLAALLGLPLTEFPGGHLGVTEQPADFTAHLLKALG